MPSIERGSTANDVITAVMSRTLVYVLLEKRAILLPSIHSVFAHHVTDLLTITDIGSEEIGNISSRWVLSDLTANLQHHITYSTTS